MEHILLVVHVLIAASLIGMVLIQRSESDGFGLGSGGGSNLLSGRASANLMTRTTAILAGLFILNSLVLSVMAAHHRPASIVDTIEQQESSAPKVPVVPTAGEVKKPVVEKSAAPEVKEVKTEESTDVPAEKAVAPVVKKAAKKPVVKPAAVEAPAVPTEQETKE